MLSTFPTSSVRTFPGTLYVRGDITVIFVQIVLNTNYQGKNNIFKTKISLMME